MPPTPAEQLAQRLKQLREAVTTVNLTQSMLAAAFSPEQKVASATVSLWENPKTANASPPAARLEAYARFFATPRSLEGKPHLVPLGELTADELRRKDELEAELKTLADNTRGGSEEDAPELPRHWLFDDDARVTIICPELPDEQRGPLAAPDNPNYTGAQRYADLDALIELHGHIRAQNAPGYGVYFKGASEVSADDLTNHLVVLGGIAWNPLMAGVLRRLTDVPVRQIVDERVATGEVFSARVDDGSYKTFYPTWSDDDHKILTEDVALLARIANPFNTNRTLTICNGVHSRGVLGAVRALTDKSLREPNEAYIADRFPTGEFALLLRVPVVQGFAMSPDIRNRYNRLWAWPPRAETHAE